MVRTPSTTLQKIYNLPEFGSTLEFLTMLALSGGRLLKVWQTRRNLVISYLIPHLGRNSRSKFIGPSGT